MSTRFVFFGLIFGCMALHAAPKKKTTTDLDFDQLCAELSRVERPVHAAVQPIVRIKKEDVQNALHEALKFFPINDAPSIYEGAGLLNVDKITHEQLKQIVEGVKRKNLTDFESLIRLVDRHQIKMQGEYSAKKNLTNLYMITLLSSLPESERINFKAKLSGRDHEFLLSDVFFRQVSTYSVEIYYQFRLPHHFFNNMQHFSPEIVRLGLMIPKQYSVYANRVAAGRISIALNGQKITSLLERTSAYVDLCYMSYVHENDATHLTDIGCYLLKNEISAHPDGKTDISTPEKRLAEAARLFYISQSYYNFGICIVRYNLRKHPDPSIDISTDAKAMQYAAELFWKEVNNPQSKDKKECWKELDILFDLIEQHPGGLSDFKNHEVKMNTHIEWILKSEDPSPLKKILGIVIKSKDVSLKVGDKILATDEDKSLFMEHIVNTHKIDEDKTAYDFNVYYMLKNSETLFKNVRNSPQGIEEILKNLLFSTTNFADQKDFDFLKNQTLILISLLLKNGLASYFLKRIENPQVACPELCFSVELEEQEAAMQKELKRLIEQQSDDEYISIEEIDIKEEKSPMKAFRAPAPVKERTKEEQYILALTNLQKKEQREIEKEWNTGLNGIKKSFIIELKKATIHKVKQELKEQLSQMKTPHVSSDKVATTVIMDHAKIVEYPKYLDDKIQEVIETLKKEGRVRKSHPLTSRLSDDLLISVELDEKHRLIYRKNKNKEIEVLQIGGHYDD